MKKNRKYEENSQNNRTQENHYYDEQNYDNNSYHNNNLNNEYYDYEGNFDGSYFSENGYNQNSYDQNLYDQMNNNYYNNQDQYGNYNQNINSNNYNTNEQWDGRNEQYNQPYQNAQNGYYQQNNHSKNPKKTPLIILFIVIILIALGGGGYYAYDKYYSKTNYKEVFMEQYKVNVVAYGENKEGKVKVDIVETPSVSGIDEKAKEFLKNPEVRYTPKDRLENGNKVEVEIVLNKSQAKKNGLKVKGSFKETITVSGLTEKANDNGNQNINGIIWTKQKGRELHSFVKEWEKSLEQNYREYTIDNKVNFFGVKLPTATEDASGVRLVLKDDTSAKFRWSPEGEKYKDTYNIVAVFSDIGNYGPVPAARIYYFAIYNGKPIALVSEQNQGDGTNYLYFKPTANVYLQEGFEKIALR